MAAQYHKNGIIKKPAEVENKMKDPPAVVDAKILNAIQGSMAGMALGDALGAHVTFQTRHYLMQNPVTDLQGGGPWQLNKGEVTHRINCFEVVLRELIKSGIKLKNQSHNFK